MIKAFGFNPRPEFLRLWSNLGGSKRKVFEPTIEKIKMNADLAPPGFEGNCKMDDMEFNEHGKESEPGQLGEVDKAKSKLVETTREFCKAEGKGELDVACGEMIQTMSNRRGTRRPKERLRESTTDMHEAIDEAGVIKKKVEKVMKKA